MSRAAVGQRTAGSRRKKDTSLAARREMCSVRVGSALFGLPITHILEIVAGIRPVPVPLAPEFVGGLIHYRGDVLTTVSLRRLMDMQARDKPQDVLVLESAGECFGLLVDSVGEVLTVAEEEFEANPCTMNERGRRLFAGAYKLKDQLMVMLDPERLGPMRLAEPA